MSTLDVHSLLLLLDQNNFTKCVTVVMYNPHTRERRFFFSTYTLPSELEAGYVCGRTVSLQGA